VLAQAHPVAALLEAVTKIVALENGVVVKFEPASVVVDEPRNIGAVLLLSPDASTRVRSRVAVALTPASAQVGDVWRGNVVMVPHVVAVMELPWRRGLLVDIVDDPDRGRIRFVLERVLPDRCLEYLAGDIRGAIQRV